MTPVDRLLCNTIVVSSAVVAAGWAGATLAISAVVFVGAMGVLAARDAAVAAHDGRVSR